MGVTFLKRVLFFAAALALGASLVTVSGAQPMVQAASAVLMDADSGRVLYEKGPHTPRLIASTTKLMTALVAAERAEDVDAEVTIRAQWLGSEGSSIYLQAGERITIRGLLYGLLLQSGNDAAMAIACALGGEMTTFVGWMNDRAAALGMENTSFANPSGLNAEGHYSSAYDMALLARACLKNDLVAEICAAKSAVAGTRTFYNHNKLLSRYPGCVGMKTGYTEKAGRTLVSAARREGQTLICVTLNDPDDWNDHARLLDYGFANYPLRTLCAAGETLGAAPVSGSLVPAVPVCAGAETRCSLREEERLTVRVETVPLSAPVVPGEPAGRAVWYLNGEAVAETALVSAAPAASDRYEKQSLWRRALERLGLRGTGERG